MEFFIQITFSLVEKNNKKNRNKLKKLKFSLDHFYFQINQFVLVSCRDLKIREARLVTSAMGAAMIGPIPYGRTGLNMAGFIYACLLSRTLVMRTHLYRLSTVASKSVVKSIDSSTVSLLRTE